MKWEIKKYTEKYREQVIQFWIEICVKEFGFESWHEDIKDMDNHTYEQNNGNFWIAVNLADEVIGTIALKNIENNKGLLKSLYVKKEERKNGIAKALYNELIEFAKQNKYEIIELDTYHSFEYAIQFYKKNNFKIKQHIDDKYIMEKQLN